MNRDQPLPPTFRIEPGLRQSGLSLHQSRQIVAELYGALYLIFGMRFAVNAWFELPGRLMKAGPAFGPSMATAPIRVSAVFATSLCCALLAGGVAWWITGRTMRTARLSRARFVIWGTLAAAAPSLTLGLESREQLRVLLPTFFATVLCGGTLGLIWHQMLCRARDVASGAAGDASGGS